MLNTIEKWDRALFLFLNQFHTETVDQLMFFVSDKFGWLPLYIVLLLFFVKKYKIQVWIPIIAIGSTIALADQTSVQLFKEVFERYRPCHNEEIKEWVHLVNNKCGGKFGFVSSHASNTFALSFIVGLLLKRKILYGLLVWATLVSYSRIYLGVHYPLDVLGGAIWGSFIGLLIYRVVNPILTKRLSDG